MAGTQPRPSALNRTLTLLPMSTAHTRPLTGASPWLMPRLASSAERLMRAMSGTVRDRASNLLSEWL